MVGTFQSLLVSRSVPVFDYPSQPTCGIITGSAELKEIILNNSIKPIRKIGDFDISFYNGEMMIYKRIDNQKPQVIVLSKTEQDKLRRVLNNG